MTGVQFLASVATQGRKLVEAEEACRRHEDDDALLDALSSRCDAVAELLEFAPPGADSGDSYAARVFRAVKRYIAASLWDREVATVEVSDLHECEAAFEALQFIVGAS